MKFLQIATNPKQSIKIESIEYYIEASPSSIVVYTESGNSYEVNIPYDKFLKIVESGRNMIEQRLDQLAKNQTISVP